MRSKITMQQIADVAGVSKFAVSRALSGKTGVSEQTREYIIKVAGDLGFFKGSPGKVSYYEAGGEPETAAGTVLVLFPNIRYQNVDNKFWGDVFAGVSGRLQEHGLNIITLTQPERDGLGQLLNPDKILGVICVGAVSTPMLLEVQEMQLPLVIIDHVDAAIDCDGIFVDNYFMMKKLMAKLIARGYQRFQFVGRPSVAFSFGERWRAFQDALSEYGNERASYAAGKNPDSFDEYEDVLALPRDELPEIFICTNDSVAVNVYKALGARGIKIPSDCAVTGFDNMDFSEQMVPPLTTVHVPKEAMGAKAVDRLLQRVRSEDDYFEKTSLLGEAVFRQSTH